MGNCASTARIAEKLLVRQKSQEETKQPLIVVDFTKLCSLGTFPIFSSVEEKGGREKDSLFCDLECVNTQSAFVVYISHNCPLDEYDDYPDNILHKKLYENCVKGISSVWSTMTEGLSSCYVFIDVSCANVEITALTKCRNLKAIMQYCDIIFTPILNIDDVAELVASDEHTYHSQCTLAGWVDKSLGYLNHGWPRLEMFYGCNIPIVGGKKQSNFIGDLASMLNDVPRRHFIYFYDSVDDESGRAWTDVESSLTLLPPLENSQFDRYNPLDGKVSSTIEKDEISRMLNKLLPEMVFTQPQYDSSGRRSGHGRWELSGGQIYEGRCVHNEPNGYGKSTFIDSGDVYQGMWENGYQSGQGVMSYKDGNTFEGTWKTGKQDGRGCMTFSNGDKYNGDWRDGQICGHGVMVYAAAKCTYSGQWENGKEHGVGTVKYLTGDEYVGAWANGQRHGKGKYIYAEGDIYDGDWANNLEHGKGRLVCDDSKEQYEGDWRLGKEHGRGLYTDEAGNIYDGEFIKGKESGRGVMKYMCGDVYSGLWLNGKPNGEGVMTYEGGDVYTGQWTQGKRHGHGVLVYADGGKYEGSFCKGLEEGRGTFWWEGGDVYEGEWKEGLEDGYGKLTMSDGDVYEGEWLNGKEHGKGVMHYEDGDVYEGVWARGKRLDTAKVTALGEDILHNFSKANKKINEVSKKVKNGAYELNSSTSNKTRR